MVSEARRPRASCPTACSSTADRRQPGRGAHPAVWRAGPAVQCGREPQPRRCPVPGQDRHPDRQQAAFDAVHLLGPTDAELRASWAQRSPSSQRRQQDQRGQSPPASGAGQGPLVADPVRAPPRKWSAVAIHYPDADGGVLAGTIALGAPHLPPEGSVRADGQRRSTTDLGRLISRRWRAGATGPAGCRRGRRVIIAPIEDKEDVASSRSRTA